jgi:hypothetical protein
MTSTLCSLRTGAHPPGWIVVTRVVDSVLIADHACTAAAVAGQVQIKVGRAEILVPGPDD